MTLRVDGLGVAFRRPGGRVAALSGVTLSIAPGEVVGLAGASGAGKSLIAEALVGALPRNAEVAGRVTVAGGSPRPGLVALAPQGLDALDPLAPLGRQIARFARLGGQEADVAALLARVGLPPEATRAHPHALSGGAARRALLATALATGAPWIVADEPTAGLDPAAADRVLALHADLAREGRGVLVISHDLPRLARVAARIVVLEGGRQVETAEAAAFARGALAHPFSRALWEAAGLAC